MSKFKNNSALPNLYYSDTDSLYFDGPLPSYMVDPTKLGALKLEGVYDKAVFLAPKVYALKNSTEEIIKIKGLSKEAITSNKINFDSLLILLNKDSSQEFTQSKWFKHLDSGSISVMNQIYTLKVTGNKRELIYKDNKLIGTDPFTLND
jgi:hypothetical protein